MKWLILINYSNYVDVYADYIEQLLQETIKQCNTGGGDLSDEEEPKPLCSASSDQTKQLQYNSTKVNLANVKCNSHRNYLFTLLNIYIYT